MKGYVSGKVLLQLNTTSQHDCLMQYIQISQELYVLEYANESHGYQNHVIRRWSSIK